MAKRTISAILIILLILPAAIAAGGVLFAPESPFDIFDANRESSLSEALGEIPTSKSGETALPDGDRYIVKFKSDTGLTEIEKALNGTPYRLLAESTQRLVAVVPESDYFFQANADIIDYYEPDLVRGVLATTDDPATIPAYGPLDVYGAWDIAVGKSNVIVAVLDTGVDRTHEDLKDASILAGYDAVKRVSGVNGDDAGHGTGVIGLIAATANNGKGIAGIAHGVTVLPVKVSASGTTIYSSDLIAGIRFAADAGAKIINMSVGGYSSSYAEQDAVSYAVSKGCILISAAGNGGTLPYADQKSYPASYEGVISVASCNENGERSEFSQYNDAVDVAAYGENIPVPFVENGASVYRYDSGTSYACAFVSGIAALAASRIDNSARFENAEFLSLLIDCLGSARNDELGYGVINAKQALEKSVKPIITGVVNNGIYYHSVRIGFNRGKALLDGEIIEDGETIFSNGRHILTVIDGDYSRSVMFRLDYDPLSYSFKEFSSFAYFEFTRGSATLDGFPYKSGERISASGRHSFTLTDGDEYLEKEIHLQYTLPAVLGVENGAVYSTPVEIRIIGDGVATLDGKEIFGEAAVAKNGTHLLTVKSGNGAKTERISFEINIPDTEIYSYDLADAHAAVDEEWGYMCLYGESLVGARIYSLDAPEKYLHFLPVGRVYAHEFIGDRLLLIGDAGFTFVSREQALNGLPAVEATVAAEGMTYYAYADGIAYGFGNEGVFTIDLQSGEATLFAQIGFNCERVLYSNGVFWLVSDNDDLTVYLFDVASQEIKEFNVKTALVGMPAFFEGGYFAIGNRLFDAESGENVLEFVSNTAIAIKDGMLFTESGIIDIATGKEIGSFPFSVSSIVFGENANYLFGFESDFAVIGNADGIAAYGAAERTASAFSESERINPYRVHLFYDMHSTPISVAASAESTYFIFDGKNILFGFNNGDYAEITPIPLKFEPKAVSVTDGYIAITFKTAPFIYLAPLNNTENGVYLKFNAPCKDAFVLNGRLYAVSDSKLAYCPIVDGNCTVTSVSANTAALHGDEILVLFGNELSLYNSSLNRIRRTTAVGKAIYSDSAIAVGKTVYVNSQFSEKITLDADILALRGNTAVTKNGVYSISERRYVGKLGINAQRAVITPENAVIAIGNASISVCSYGDGKEVSHIPEISGITEGGIYLGNAVISYGSGIGYLDGEPFNSGDSVNAVGEHTFMLALPCGNSILTKFTVEAQISQIEFLVSDRIMSVGETVSLRVRYLPEGASSLPVSFKCDSEGIVINESGEVKALAVGRYVVTATVESDYGSFTANAVITVRDDLITFPEDSGITINRDRGFILGIPAGTDVSVIEAMFGNGKDVDILRPNGKNANGFVATGYKVVLFKDGLPTDELTTVVLGDTDGDGCISAYDMYLHERILRGYDYAPEFYASADMNGNGVVADNDYRALRNIILRREESPLGTPSTNLFGACSVQSLSHIESGDIIDVPVYISGCKYARGVNGVIEYSEGLEFISAESTGWEVGCRDMGGKISLYAYGEDGSSCNRAFKPLINLRFRVTAEAGKTASISAESLTASFPDGARLVPFESRELAISAPSFGDFKIEIFNASAFEFSADEYEYEITVPYNSALADVKVTHGENETVTVQGAVIPDSGSGTVVVRRNDASGKAYFYTINVTRSKEPKFDTNCRLRTLEIEGFHLNPHFSPDVTEYSISVPRGTKKINVYCTAQNPDARVFIGDTSLYGKETDISITVVTPDGEAMVYTIHVLFQRDAEPPVTKQSGKALASVIVALISVASMVFIGVYISKQKGK